MKSFWKIFALQLIDFILICINFRAVAHLQYVPAILTDTLMCAMGWSFFQIMKDDSSRGARAGFIVGGAVGSLIGMYVTRLWG
jgi:hypothetical protein